MEVKGRMVNRNSESKWVEVRKRLRGKSEFENRFETEAGFEKSVVELSLFGCVEW